MEKNEKILASENLFEDMINGIIKNTNIFEEMARVKNGLAEKLGGEKIYLFYINDAEETEGILKLLNGGYIQNEEAADMPKLSGGGYINSNEKAEGKIKPKQNTAENFRRYIINRNEFAARNMQANYVYGNTGENNFGEGINYVLNDVSEIKENGIQRIYEVSEIKNDFAESTVRENDRATVMILPEILNQNEKDISRNFENKKNIFSNQYAAEYILYKNRGKDEISGRIFDTTENIKYFRNAERLNEQSEKFTKERIEIAPGVQNENGIFCFSFGNIPQFMTAGNLNESFLNEISERRYGFILNGPNENSLYEQQEKIVGNSPERFDVYSESEYGGVSAAEISMREFENNEMPKNKEISDSIEHIYGYEKNAELSGNEKIEIFFENGSIVNNFTKDMDIDDIVDEFAERLREAICSSAEG